MHLLDQRLLGIGVVLLLAMLVAVKRVATGSIIERPTGSLLVQLVNIFNLFFLLVVNPLAAIALIARALGDADPTYVVVSGSRILVALEIAGALLYLIGFLLMAWALIVLGSNYQLGGSAPRPRGQMVRGGPYRLIRHPMYTAALCIALGLSCLIQSGAVLCVFAVYLVLIVMLIPIEEQGLQAAYDEEYGAYRHGTWKLIPFVY